MKRILLTSAIALSFFAAEAQQEEWNLVWSDEFDQDGMPDNTKWSFDTQGNQWDWGNDELQNYTPESEHNAWVEDGNLIIEARRESYYWPGDGQTRNYTSARLRTKDKGDWTYGKFEIRALLPSGVGIWPAIWMLATDEEYGGWPKSGELDIMENVGFDADKVHFNIHCESYNGAKGNNKGTYVFTSRPSENWHIYGMEWDEENIRFYLDGELTFTYSNDHQGWQSWPYNRRFHLLLNIAVGGSWGGQQGVDDNIFPQRMLVDYVRVYEKKKETALVTASSEPNRRLYQAEDGKSITISSAKGETITIISAQGSVVEKRTHCEANENFDTSDLPAGLYIAIIGDDKIKFSIK